jgi:hypothetical protein
MVKCSNIRASIVLRKILSTASDGGRVFTRTRPLRIVVLSADWVNIAMLPELLRKP